MFVHGNDNVIISHSHEPDDNQTWIAWAMLAATVAGVLVQAF
jgi:hypothetical protein